MKKLLLSISMIFIVLMAYAQSCPDGKHPHAIDLGLPSGTKWFCRQIIIRKDEEKDYGLVGWHHRPDSNRTLFQTCQLAPG